MAKPVNFEITKTSDLDVALKMISFPVNRIETTFSFKEKTFLTGNEAIVRADLNLIYFGEVSKSYKLITHEQAFNSAILAFQKTKVPFELKTVALDKDGAKMMARFQFKKPYRITSRPKDIVSPQLVLINSYDGETALGFDLGSERESCLSIAGSDLKARFMHFGTKADPDQIALSAIEALNAFEHKIVPHYQKMASIEITQTMAEHAVIAATESNTIPKRIAEFAMDCVTNDRFKMEGFDHPSVWTLFNAFTWTSTHQLNGSPTRQREIEHKIAREFKDAGSSLLDRANRLDKNQIAEWTQKILTEAA